MTKAFRAFGLVLSVLAAACLAMAAFGSAGADAPPLAPATQPATAPAGRKPTDEQLADARAVFDRLLSPTPALTPEAKQRIGKLIADLAHAQFRVREQATRRLSELGPPAVPFVTDATGSRDPEVVIRAKLILDAIQARAGNVGAELSGAIDTLVAAGDTRVVPMLIRLLPHPNLTARCSAGYGLRRVTGQSFGYSGYGEPRQRDQAAAKWKQWWARNRAAFVLDRARVAQAPAGVLIADDRVNTVTLVTLTGEVVWSRKFSRHIHCAAALPNGHYIVGFTDSAGPETNLAEFDLADQVVWTERKFGLGTKMVYDVRALANGNLLIAYVGDHHVSEVTPAGKLVWQMKGGLQSPGAAERLPNGNTLITVNHSSKVIEVTPAGKVVWEKAGLHNPCDATLLPNGNVLISEWGAHRIFEADRTGKIVWERKCTDCASAICRLGDGTILINDRKEGTILVGPTGRKIRTIFEHNSGGKIRLAPAGFVRLRRKRP